MISQKVEAGKNSSGAVSTFMVKVMLEEVPSPKRILGLIRFATSIRTEDRFENGRYKVFRIVTIGLA